MELRELFLQVFDILAKGENVEFTLILNGQTIKYIAVLGDANLCTLHNNNSRLIILDRELLNESDNVKLFSIAHEVGHTFNINTTVNRWIVKNSSKHPIITKFIATVYSSYINSLRLSLSRKGKVLDKEIEADRYAFELFPGAIYEAFEYFEKFVNKAPYKTDNLRKLSLKEIELRKEALL